MQQKNIRDDKHSEKVTSVNHVDQETEDVEQVVFYEDTADLPTELVKWIEGNRQDIVIIWNENGQAQYVSKSIESLLGYFQAELEHAYWYDYVAPEDIVTIKDKLHSARSQGERFRIHIKRKYGHAILNECILTKHFYAHRIYYTTILHEVADNNEMNEMMMRAEQMSIAGQLAAGMAHEIRNPLTSIKGFIQLLQSGVNRKEAYFNIMLDEIDKIESITSELLSISKPTTDSQQDTSMTSMLEEVMVLLTPIARKKNITFQQFKDDDCVISCDRSQMKQVLINLIKNAVEVMGDGGTIQTQLHRSNDRIILDVIDEGPGIPDDIIHKIGEPFFTTKQGGTGLGLMISKNILAKHNGILKIERNKHKGSTFTLEMKHQ